MVDSESEERVPAFRTDVVDTTGAATLSRPGSCAASRRAATAPGRGGLGCAVAGLVAGGLGSDHGDFDLEAADAFAAATPTTEEVVSR